MKLGVCSACKRHVRIDEVACPFCGADAEGLLLRPSVRRPKRSSRAAYLMLSATTSLIGAAACDGEDQAPDDEQMAVPIYGAPIQPSPKQDASVGDDMGPEPTAGSGGQLPVYGVPITPDNPAPAVDGGMPDPNEDDDMSLMPIYGLAPTPEDGLD